MRTMLMLSLLALSGCGLAFVSGDGRLESQEREVGAFRGVSVHSGLNALVTTGSRSVTVRTDANLQSLVETAVEGEVLQVRLKPGVTITHASALEVVVTNDVIEQVSASGGSHVTAGATPVASFPVDASGGSHVTVSGISATSLNATASGGSHLTVSGAATEAAVVGSGGSILDLRAVPLSTANVDLSGGSSLRATISSRVSGSLSGGSTATITGQPNHDTLSLSGGSAIEMSSP